MDGEIQKTMGVPPSGKLKHFRLEGKFICLISPQSTYGQCVDHKQFTRLTPEQDARIIEYTTKKDNKIVEVFEIKRLTDPDPLIGVTEIKIVTHDYESEQYYPLTIISENCYYSEDIFYRQSEALKLFMRDLDQVEIFYHRVVDEYEKFLQATGLYIQDMNANNILVNGCKDFRIVDIASIQIPTGRPIKIDPVGLLLTGKLRWADPNMEDPILDLYMPRKYAKKMMRRIDAHIKPRYIQ